MVINEDSLMPMFKEAISIFFIKERRNILTGVSERNLTGKLSTYLDCLRDKYNLTNYYSDPEYNRKQNSEIKTILDENMKVIRINCDIIIHSRGEIMEKDNLIAIEMKKTSNKQSEKEDDKRRLRALTKDSYDDVWSKDGKVYPEHVCGYILGFYLEIDIENQTCLFECYKKGQKQIEWIENF